MINTHAQPGKRLWNRKRMICNERRCERNILDEKLQFPLICETRINIRWYHHWQMNCLYNQVANNSQRSMTLLPRWRKTRMLTIALSRRPYQDGRECLKERTNNDGSTSLWWRKTILPCKAHLLIPHRFVHNDSKLNNHHLCQRAARGHHAWNAKFAMTLNNGTFNDDRALHEVNTHDMQRSAMTLSYAAACMRSMREVKTHEMQKYAVTLNNVNASMRSVLTCPHWHKTIVASPSSAMM